MKSDWVWIFAVKIVLFAIGVFSLSSWLMKSKSIAFSSEKEEPLAQKAEQKDSSNQKTWDLPSVPEGQIALSEANSIRNQLLLVRKDVEAKIQSLALSKASLEKTREKVTSELKLLSEQKRIMEETLQNEKKVKEERVKEALVFVEKMEPRKAAPLIEAMDRDLVIALFKKLPPRNVTRILENVSSKKATELMEYYTRLRSGREYELLKELGLCQADGAPAPAQEFSSVPTDVALANPKSEPLPKSTASPEVPLESTPVPPKAL